MTTEGIQAPRELWLRRGDRTLGLFSVPQLKALHAQGKLAVTDTIRVDGAATWIPLSQVKGFAAASATEPAPSSRPAVESPRGIYDAVRGETDAILRALEQPARNADLSGAIDTARESFRQLKVETDDTLRELDKNAEWDAFTVALYGETNAGKSTIIETLRILMGEKTKLEQQRKFRETLDKLGIQAKDVEAWTQKKQQIAECDAELKSVTLRFSEAHRQQQALERGLASQIESLAAAIRALPFWRRGLAFVWKIPAQAELDAANAKLGAAAAGTRQLLDRHEQEKSAILGKVETIRKSVAHIDAAITELEACADGSIIGDGQSDFTRESTRYEFEVNGSKLVLLDVPGIEGKEELVREPIMQAVRKAHAVFYVTRKADPPQKGDEKSGSKGTLEKIKEHLGAQTEVWTIFNKGIKSAEQLRMRELVNAGERGGLAVLEEEMRRQLGEHYAGLLSVSAYAAFVTSTGHLLPGGAKSKDRSKFLAAFDADAIHGKTGFRDLIAKLTTEMSENTRVKIRKSNFKKAREAVLLLKGGVDRLNQKRFVPLFEKLEGEAHTSALQLDSAADALKRRLESDATALIDKVRNRARKDVYDRIEQDIDNDVFKTDLEQHIKAVGQVLEKELPKVVNKSIGEFQKEVQGIVEQFQEHVQEFLDDASKMAALNFNLSIKIDNGVSVAGLIGSAVGAVGLIFVTGGWALLLGAFGVLLSFVKAIRSFLSSDYKKEQQRKAADENLDRVFDSVKANYAGQLQKNAVKLDEKMDLIKAGFKLPALQAEQIKSSLAESVRRLALIFRKNQARRRTVMETTLDVFKAEQAKARAIQGKLLEFLLQGEAAGVSIDPALKEKLQQSIAGIEKLKVALIGGFSEGKTSIAAAWLGKLDKSSMNISHQESSNAVAVYQVSSGLTLIDTPGLFGYKDKFNADTREQEKYKDITKKYVSEAHLVLYVMNSTNPLKESHKDDLNWLFRDLNLLPRTVFVLSRFDEVSDVADEEDYQRNVAIKKQNVLSRLKDLIGLKDAEAQALTIVAVSANPFDAGVEHWLSEPERFMQLSHIPLLQQATTEKIKTSGGLEKMALETRKSIIRDVLNREVPVAVEKDEALAEEAGKLDKSMKRAEADANAINRRIADTQIALKEFVLDHFTGLILQLDGVGPETMSAFFEREIGDGGIVLDTKIQNAFSKRVSAVSSELVRIQTSLDSDISAFDSHMAALGRKGLSFIVSNNVINAASIKATRDMLGLSLKFKPWGAVKLANGLNGALSIVGVALEVWGSMKDAERKQAFLNLKKQMKEDLEGQRRELLGKINAADFSTEFFPGFVSLKQQMTSLSAALQKTREQRASFAQWRKSAEAIEAEFTVLKG